MALEPGDLVHGRYRIDGRLGQGGMGAVYRAFDTLLERRCALKELRLGHLPADDGTRQAEAALAPLGAGPVTREKAAEQFRREAQLLARLDHPGLPKVTDYFSVGPEAYLVMTLVEGRNLADVLEEAGAPLPEAQVLAWIDQVLGALAYCHGQSVIHRDVKPANIILAPDGTVHLVDFGIAKPEDASGTTTIGARATTPGYSPPEQYGGHVRTDARSDIYAVGATMYALLTGQNPPGAFDRVTGQDMPAPRGLVPAISPRVNAAVMRALAIRPDERFQSAAAMRAALSVPAASVGGPQPTALARSTGRRLALAAAVLVGAIALLAGYRAYSRAAAARSRAQLTATAWAQSTATSAALALAEASTTAAAPATARARAASTATAQAAATRQAAFAAATQAGGALAGTRAAETRAAAAATEALQATIAACRVSQVVEVSADAGWQDTGITVRQGETLTITYLSGLWCNCVPNGCPFFDAGGVEPLDWPDSIVGECRHLALIARLADGPPFCVGTHFSARVDRAGPLRLRGNDKVTEDDAGSVTVRVDVY